MTHKDPKGFVDLLVDTVADGRLYMCATCLNTAGNQTGMLSKQQAETLTRRLTAANDEINKLQIALAEEKEDKFVTLPDLREALRDALAAGVS
jgi:hypothetical protein